MLMDFIFNAAQTIKQALVRTIVRSIMTITNCFECFG